jgi:hypothetical protein
MEFRLIPVQSISSRLDETVRFPYVGTLDSDYLIGDQDDKEAGKARVQQGVIVVFAVRSDLAPDEQGKIRDLLLRSIVVDADNYKANLSIEIQPEGFDEMDIRRFFERFGFRRVSDTIMKRLAGSIHPTTVHEAVHQFVPDLGTRFETDRANLTRQPYTVAGWARMENGNLVHCFRQDAEFVVGSGIPGITVPIGMVRVVGRANMHKQIAGNIKDRARWSIGQPVNQNLYPLFQGRE